MRVAPTPEPGQMGLKSRSKNGEAYEAVRRLTYQRGGLGNTHLLDRLRARTIRCPLSVGVERIRYPLQVDHVC